MCNMCVYVRRFRFALLFEKVLQVYSKTNDPICTTKAAVHVFFFGPNTATQQVLPSISWLV